MKLKYFNDKSWEEITREERMFCAELFFQMRKNLTPFLELIGGDIEKKYDVGYEVCFYRDVLKEFKKSVKAEQLPQKRTFDLVLMSQDEIIIIEAKSYQGFDNKQLKCFDNDIKNIKKLFSIISQPLPQIKILAIHSDKYSPSDMTCSHFAKLITWTLIAKKYPTSKAIFERANEVYE
jgi:hypothetical protein